MLQNHLKTSTGDSNSLVYEFSGCGFESCWSHLNFSDTAFVSSNFKQGLP